MFFDHRYRGPAILGDPFDVESLRKGVRDERVARPIQDLSALSITHKTVGIRLSRLR
jgi:hypothetical protein